MAEGSERLAYLERLVVRERDTTIVVPVADLQWIEADTYYVRLHTATGRPRLLRERMAALEARLDPRSSSEHIGRPSFASIASGPSARCLATSTCAAHGRHPRAPESRSPRAPGVTAPGHPVSCCHPERSEGSCLRYSWQGSPQRRDEGPSSLRSSG
jgi:hypothetical protein